MDYSQFGEYTELIDPHLSSMGYRHRIVVDVGAFGRQHSNSFNLIIDCGFRALLIEPDPMNVMRIEEEMAGQMSAISLAKVAVTTNPGMTPLYHYENPMDSSILPPDGTKFSTGSSDVMGMTLESLLRLHHIPFDFDFLSIDTNGMDGAIVHSLLETPFRPGLIMYDKTSIPAVAHEELVGRLMMAGYGLVAEIEVNVAWSKQS